MADQARPVTAGVETHAEMHAAAVDQVGRVLGTAQFRLMRQAIGEFWHGWVATAR